MKFLEPNELFEERARAFCSFVETDIGTGADSLRKLRDVLLQLYSAAFTLHSPPLESQDDLPEDSERIRQERIEIERRVAATAFQDEFWLVFDPLKLDREDPVISTLSDCVADIWRDLKPGVEALDTDRDTYLSNALWEWKFSFETHWGRHAIDALRALHFQLENVG